MSKGKKEKKQKKPTKNGENDYGIFLVDGGFDLPPTTPTRQNEQPSSTEETTGKAVQF
ncbi:MAG: hypothetical protein WC523_02280 [Patescibacteria group bacterium]